MRARIIITVCLACAATSALAQLRLGSTSPAGTMSSSGALSDGGGNAFGARPQPADPRPQVGVDPRSAPPAAPASAAASSGALDHAPAPASRPIVDGAVWGSTPNPTPAPTSGSEN